MLVPDAEYPWSGCSSPTARAVSYTHLDVYKRQPPQRTADVQGVLREIDDARAEDAARRLRIGLT